MNLVVVGERGESEPVMPVRLSFIDKYTEILFNFLIDSFGLSIGLGVIGCGDVGFNTGHRVEVPHELGCKLGASITDGFSGESEFGPDMIVIDVCSTKCREFHISWKSNNVFGEPINDDYDGVVSR